MAAGLQIEIYSGAARSSACLCQGQNLRMGRASSFVPGFSHHFATGNDDAADPGIRMSGAKS